MSSLVVIVLAAVLATLARQKLTGGILGKREAYGRPMSDWAGVSILGLGLGFGFLLAGSSALAFLMLGAVLFVSYMTVSQVKPRRRR